MESTLCLVGRHDIFVLFLMVFFTFAMTLAPTHATRNMAYRAAVYEHAVMSPPPKFVSRAEAVTNMMKNIRVYEKQTKIAASKGAKIIVFPEYGVLGIYLNRTTVKSYLEEVPDPQCTSWNPSESPNDYKGTDIQRELSRIAKENKIYMVVNLGTKVPCTISTDPSCPSDGQYQYNTNVVYSAKGTLVAVYHKRNLYIDLPFNPARETEYVTFDTPFGRFGTVVCFDLMFKEPTFVLLQKHNVRNLAYPTAWVKIPPFYRSIMVHSGLARGYSINLLAADLHANAHRAHGSGLYSPNGPKTYFYDTAEKASKLLIADMDPISEETPLTRSTSSSLSHETNYDTNTDETILKGSVLGLEYFFKPLTGAKGEIHICYGLFCCSADYERQQTTEEYALGIGNGLLHVETKKLYVQTCTLSKCENGNCVAEIKEAETIFDKLILTGHNFEGGQVSPRVTAMNGSSYVFIDKEWTYNYTGQIYIEKSMSLPLHSAVLNGRIYDNDPPRPKTGHKYNLPKCASSSSSKMFNHGFHLNFLAAILSLLYISI